VFVFLGARDLLGTKCRAGHALCTRDFDGVMLTVLARSPFSYLRKKGVGPKTIGNNRGGGYSPSPHWPSFRVFDDPIRQAITLGHAF